jgi:hypothetical protein
MSILIIHMRPGHLQTHKRMVAKTALGPCAEDLQTACLLHYCAGKAHLAVLSSHEVSLGLTWLAYSYHNILTAVLSSSSSTSFLSFAWSLRSSVGMGFPSAGSNVCNNDHCMHACYLLHKPSLLTL